jgi:hypothetical protein
MFRTGTLHGTAAALWLLALAPFPARSDEIPCSIPDGLAFSGFALPQSRAQFADGKRFVVLVIGGSSMGGVAAGGKAYALPSRLEARLRVDFPDKEIAVIGRDVDKGNTRVAADQMATSIRDTDAKLVVWETGSSAAASGNDIEMFGTNLESGINAAKGAKADIIVMDLQYAPSIARVTNQVPYSDVIRGVAEMAEIPMLPRSALMRAWSDNGELDLDTDSPPERIKVARKLYDCLAGMLATGIVGALR